MDSKLILEAVRGTMDGALSFPEVVNGSVLTFDNCSRRFSTRFVNDAEQRLMRRLLLLRDWSKRSHGLVEDVLPCEPKRDSNHSSKCQTDG